MTVFDLTLHVATTSAEAREPEGGEAHVAIACTVVQGLPTPQGVVGIGIGQLRYMLSKEEAIKHAESVLAAAQELPDPSNLAIATDMGSVSQMAEEIKRVTGP